MSLLFYCPLHAFSVALFRFVPVSLPLFRFHVVCSSFLRFDLFSLFFVPVCSFPCASFFWFPFPWFCSLFILFILFPSFCCFCLLCPSLRSFFLPSVCCFSVLLFLFLRVPSFFLFPSQCLGPFLLSLSL